MVVGANSVVSQLNMYRIDDPIAHCIVSGEPNFPTNEVLAKGGHTDYWVEKRVCGKLMAMIRCPTPPPHRYWSRGNAASVKQRRPWRNARASVMALAIDRSAYWPPCPC